MQRDTGEKPIVIGNAPPELQTCAIGGNAWAPHHLAKEVFDIIANECGGDYVVAVSNHTGDPWEGTLRLADAAGLQGAAREMTNDSELPVRTRGDELLVKLSVPPWDVQICRVS